jgi:L-methionine (R)-S-oxide reductase
MNQTPRKETRQKAYPLLYSQIKALVEDEPDLVARQANICAAIKQTFGFFWIGFYRVKDDQLVLGPFQGPVACTRIGYGKGVCGTAWKEKRSIVVPNVHQFPGHIACSSESNSEIVIPVFNAEGEVGFVLDIDSVLFDDFSDLDARELEAICKFVYA